MTLPQGSAAIIDQMFQKFETLARGTDDQRRELTFKICQVFNARLGPRWGTKKAGPGNPQSKDSIAYILDSGNLDVWDWQSNATRQRIINDGQQPTWPNTPHIFIETPAHDWLAPAPVELPTPIPTPTPIGNNTDQILQQILDEVKKITAYIRDNA